MDNVNTTSLYAGLIIYQLRKGAHSPHFLLLRKPNTTGDKWTAPQANRLPTENHLSCALRITRALTNIAPEQLKIDTRFRYDLTYLDVDGHPRHVIYFLATTASASENRFLNPLDGIEARMLRLEDLKADQLDQNSRAMLHYAAEHVLSAQTKAKSTTKDNNKAATETNVSAKDEEHSIIDASLLLTPNARGGALLRAHSLSPRHASGRLASSTAPTPPRTPSGLSNAASLSGVSGASTFTASSGRHTGTPVSPSLSGSLANSGRRNPLFRTMLCAHWQKFGTCRNGAGCGYAHGETELQQSPFHKIKLCDQFMRSGRCDNISTCSYAHGHEELKRWGWANMKVNVRVDPDSDASGNNNDKNADPVLAQKLEHKSAVKPLISLQDVSKSSSAFEVQGLGLERMSVQSPGIESDLDMEVTHTNKSNGVNAGAAIVSLDSGVITAESSPEKQQADPNSNYKTRLCRHFYLRGRCEWGDGCQFAHGEHELRTRNNLSEEAIEWMIHQIRDQSKEAGTTPKSKPAPASHTQSLPKQEAKKVAPLSMPRASSHQTKKLPPSLNTMTSDAKNKANDLEIPLTPLAATSYEVPICQAHAIFGFCEAGASCPFAHVPVAPLADSPLRTKAVLNNEKPTPANSYSFAEVSRREGVTQSPTRNTQQQKQIATSNAEKQIALVSADGSTTTPQKSNGNTFKTRLCRHFELRGECPVGEICQFAHGEDDLRSSVARPDIDANNSSERTNWRSSTQQRREELSQTSPQSKTKLCKHFAKTNVCPLKDKCQFAHGVDELRKETDNSNMSKPRSNTDDRIAETPQSARSFVLDRQFERPIQLRYPDEETDDARTDFTTAVSPRIAKLQYSQDQQQTTETHGSNDLMQSRSMADIVRGNQRPNDYGSRISQLPQSSEAATASCQQCLWGLGQHSMHAKMIPGIVRVKGRSDSIKSEAVSEGSEVNESERQEMQRVMDRVSELVMSKDDDVF